MENTALKAGSESFQKARTRVADEACRRIESDSRYAEIQGYLAKLDALRENGLFAVRKVRAERDALIADHNMTLKRTEKANARRIQALKRESKRQAISLKFAIADGKRELKAKLDKEVSRERKILFFEISKGAFKAKDPELLKGYANDQPFIVKGYQLLVSYDAAYLAARRDETSDLAQKISALAASSQKDSEYQYRLLSLKAQHSFLVYELGQVEKLVESFRKLDSISGVEAYFKRLIAISIEALYADADRDIVKLIRQRRASEFKIEQDYRAALKRIEAEGEAALKAIRNDAEFKGELEKNSLAEASARAREKEVAKQVAALVDSAYDLSNDLFSEYIAGQEKARKELSSYLNGYLKDFKSQHYGDRNAIARETDMCYRQLALGAIAQEAMENLHTRVNRSISATVREMKKPKVKKEILDYYQPEEVIKDPALVDTANMRLVIKGSDQKVDVKEIERRDAVIKGIGLFFIYLFLAVCAILVLFPFYWMINTSLKSTEEIVNSITPTLWPRHVQWSNYVDVFDRFDFGTYLGNTLVVGSFSTMGVLITCIFSAFAFARLKFKGRDTLFMVFLATMMIPGEMMVITNYITVANFGWIGSDANRLDAYLSMIMPFCISVFYIYLLRQNFKQIPEELYLAAKVDGKSDWSFLWKVMVPLCQPTLITIGILQLMGSWNAYVWPNLVANKDEYRLISNGLRNSFTTSTGISEYGLQMAATVYVTVPLLLLFIVFRKYIMKGMGRAGIKG